MAEILLHNLKLLESKESLSSAEYQIVDILIMTVSSLKEQNVIARIAGGWVRDKLLGLSSDDIDVSVENIDGVSFANEMEKVIPKDKYPHFKIIENPEQSAHLSSARIQVFEEYQIDICGLRWDDYSNGSRIPVVSVGTLQQDAMRRDFTINCLFYNILDSRVEDLTGGIDDLQNGILRTPQPTELSFKDDPLRILRAFRFASRFNLQLDSLIIPSAQNAIQEYIAKVSPDRALQEVIKSLDGNNAIMFFQWSIESGLFRHIFDPLNMWELDEHEVFNRVSYCGNHSPNNNRHNIYLACILFPIFEMPKVKDPSKKNSLVPALEYAVIRGLKMTAHDYTMISTLIKGAQSYKNINHQLNRVSVGRFIMDIGEMWSYVKYILFDDDEYTFFTDVFEKYVQEQDLSTAYLMRPLMKGNDLAKALNITNGKLIGDLLKNMLDWQLENPNGNQFEYLEWKKTH